MLSPTGVNAPGYNLSRGQLARRRERPCLLRAQVDRPAFDRDFTGKYIGRLDRTAKSGVEKARLVSLIAQIGPLHARLQHTHRFEQALGFFASDDDAIGASISLRQPSPAFDMQRARRVEIAPFDSTMCAVRNRR